MPTLLELDADDRLHFMRALYAVFWRDEGINGVERPVVTTLGQLFDLHLEDFKVGALPAALIAQEVNAVKSIPARVYFMRIIHDVYRKEITELWFMGPETEHAKKFRSIYAELKDKVRVS